MKPITKELIEQYMMPKKIRRTLWGWRVDLLSGASVTITKNKIDFGKYRKVENRKNISEALYECEVMRSVELGAEAWGGLRFYGEPSSKDYADFLEYAASQGIDTGDQGLVFRHCGPEAAYKNHWHGFTINWPDGSFFKADCGALVKVCGDVMRPALRMIHEVAPDRVVVRGKPELLIVAVHCGRSLGIEVIPEDELKWFYTFTVNAILIGCSLLALLWLDLGHALLVGFGGGMLIWFAVAKIFRKQIQAAARRRGVEITKSDLLGNDDQRKASIEAARRNGML